MIKEMETCSQYLNLLTFTLVIHVEATCIYIIYIYIHPAKSCPLILACNSLNSSIGKVYFIVNTTVPCIMLHGSKHAYMHHNPCRYQPAMSLQLHHWLFIYHHPVCPSVSDML